MVVKMEQKDMNNLSPAELKAMADALLAADDEKQAKAKTKAAPAADKTAAIFVCFFIIVFSPF